MIPVLTLRGYCGGVWCWRVLLETVGMFLTEGETLLLRRISTGTQQKQLRSSSAVPELIQAAGTRKAGLYYSELFKRENTVSVSRYEKL